MTPRPTTLLRWCTPETLQTRMVLLVTGLMATLILAVGWIFSGLIGTVMEGEIGRKALMVAESVSSIPEIRLALMTGDPHRLVQPLAEEIRAKTGAEFIVVGDRSGRRFSHPDPSKVGMFMVGGDNLRAIEGGEAYVSKAVGTLGPSIRGKAPIFGAAGEVIGVVSVGYLVEDVRETIRVAQQKSLPLVALVLIFGIGGAVVLSRSFKRAIFGLEPKEIAALLQERTAILETIREGVVAGDETGRLTLANQSALGTLGLSAPGEILGRTVAEVFPESGMEEVLQSGERQLDRELVINGSEMIFNVIPLRQEEAITGVVASFRRKDELDILARELSAVRQYADLLRVQAHEYSNKLHTIGGLIQLESYSEALELVVAEDASLQDFVSRLTHIAPDPILSALLIGKFNHAAELKVGFALDPRSSMAQLPAELDRTRLVTILGNLLDNAFEAAREGGGEPLVRLTMNDAGPLLTFAVEDSGPGVDAELAERIFQKGVSTKGRAGRGVGLFLVANALAEVGGRITLGKAELGGACFTFTIPKPDRS